MSIEGESSYDEIPYTDHCFPYTHPDRLATIARLFGIESAPVGEARVLELGCAAGGNLIPMALELAQGRFVGVDLSARQVADGHRVVQAIGLENIELRAMSITDLDDRFGTFDYIVCHGVYSWVPEPVREKILDVCAGLLAPNGVAYVSYNTYPGWHARGMLREMMAYHVRRAPTALDRVAKAREFVEQMTRVIPNKASAYARILNIENEFLGRAPNSYLYHEHLEEINSPCYFHEFMERAGARGLGVLCEARAAGMSGNLSPEASDALEGWADDEVEREQYLDFLCNRTFRRSLLCHSTVARNRAPLPDAVAQLSVGTIVAPVADEPDVRSDKAEEFRRPEGSATVATNNPIIKAALVALNEIRPRAIPFESLCNHVCDRLNEGGANAFDADDGPRVLREAILRCFLSDLVDLHVQPPQFTVEPSERPVASPLARHQAAERDRVTNLSRRTVELNDFDRAVLRQLDGTRDRDTIAQALVALVEAEEFTLSHDGQPIRDRATISNVVVAELNASLSRLGRLALLRQ